MNPATMRRLATGIGLLSLVAALVLTVMLIKKAQTPTTAAPAACARGAAPLGNVYLPLYRASR
jgi:hypothetical protein